jgi:HEAT repeat protein
MSRLILPRRIVIRPVRTICHIVATVLVLALGSVAWAEDVAELARSLTAGDAAAREKAADGLATAGAAAKSAVPALSAALADSMPAVRWRAARALAAIGPAAKPAGGALIKLLADPDSKVRGYAAFALGKCGDSSPAAVAALARAAVAPDAMVRRSAIGALRALKLPRDVSIPLMAKVLVSADPASATAALETLAEAGPAAIPFLTDALKQPAAAYWACLALADIGPAAKAAVGPLATVAQSADPEVRMQAIIALGAVGPAAKSALPVLISALQTDKSAAVRYAAAFAIRKIGSDDPAALSALRQAVENQNPTLPLDPTLQMIASWALACLEPSDKQNQQRAVQLLVSSLASTDPNVRRMAISGLADLKPPPEIAGPAFTQLMQSIDPKAIPAVIEALGTLGSEFVPRIAARLKEKGLRLYAAEVLGRMGSQAAAAVPQLVEALGQTNGDADFRREVQFALGKIGAASAPATAELIKSLGDADESVRNSALFALGRIGPAAKQAVPALERMSHSDDSFEAFGSIWAWLQIDGGNQALVKRAVPILATALTADSELERLGAATALGRIGRQAQAALGPLKHAEHDPSAAVREAAAAAVKEIEAANP